MQLHWILSERTNQKRDQFLTKSTSQLLNRFHNLITSLRAHTHSSIKKQLSGV